MSRGHAVEAVWTRQRGVNCGLQHIKDSRTAKSVGFKTVAKVIRLSQGPTAERREFLGVAR
jgi:hypothetical protein